MPEMILVREVKTERVPRNTIAITKHARIPITMYDIDCISFPYETEEVRGERFVSHDGNIVCIGMCGEVRDAIGLPLGVFERQQKEIAKLEQKVADMNQRTEAAARKLRSLSLWQRCKVFLGADPMKFCV